jgi:hypothetical protein
MINLAVVDPMGYFAQWGEVSRSVVEQVAPEGTDISHEIKAKAHSK